MADTADLVHWSGHKNIVFFLKSNEIRGVKDITITASADTEDETTGGEKFTKKKNSGSYKITLTAVLNAALGVAVKEVALTMTEAARQANTGYFYMCNKKLFPNSFMATEAKVSKLVVTRKGEWSYAEVAFTLKQSSKHGGEDDTDGKKKGVKGYTAIVYYSLGSGSITKVMRFSKKSYADALKKAWAVVPKTAKWASTNPKQASAPEKGTKVYPATTGTEQKDPATDPAQTQPPTTTGDKISDAKKKSDEILKDARTKKPEDSIHPEPVG